MPYKYIERAYGVVFRPGDVVTFTGGREPRRGEVMRVRGDPQYVRVRFDDGQKGDCHPGELRNHVSHSKQGGAPDE